MSTEELSKILHSLQKDVHKSLLKLNEAKEEDFEFYARAYIRSLASWIEGIVWVFKYTLVRIEYQWHKGLPTESQLYLYEFEWRIADSGKPVSTTRKIGSKENLKAFLYVMHEMFPDFDPDLSSRGWGRVIRFYQIRDRMMHPKNLSALDIQKRDLEEIDLGRKWLEELIAGLSESLKKRLSLHD